MIKSDFSYISADGHTTIHAVKWLPDSAPTAVIQIAHGITEHVGRYDAFAEFFTSRGFAVVANDHLGHGLSIDPKSGAPMYFGPSGSFKYVVEDVKTCTSITKAEHPGLPVCLVGFSLGSFVVRCLLGDEGYSVDASVWVGTGQTSGIERFLAGIVVKQEERKFGDAVGTPTLQKLTMETYNKRFEPCRTSADWLCANDAAVDEYLADKLCGDGFTVGSFRELLCGMAISASDAHVKKLRRDLPILLLSGGDDPVGGFGKGVEAVSRQLKKHRFADVEKKIFAGMRHDVFHEVDAAAVLEAIAEFASYRLNRA